MRRLFLHLLTVTPRSKQPIWLVHQSTTRLRTRWGLDYDRSRVRARHLSVNSQTEHVSDNHEEPSLSLSDKLKAAFETNQSDGVREAVSELLQKDCSIDPEILLEASIQVAPGNGGIIISVINSCLAAAGTQQGQNVGAHFAVDLLHMLESKLDNVKTGMLTYALAYSAVEKHDQDVAQEILAKAERLSKKMAGSGRRKALAAARRKPPQKAMDCQQQLQILLGPDFAVLNETQDFVMVNKPAGTVCSHVHVTPSGKIGRKNADISLVDALLHMNVPLSTINPEAQGLVHRLDRGTSGVCILAKTSQMHAHLVTEFFTRRVKKSYRTVVSPCPDSLQGTLDLRVDGKPARSDYKVIHRRGDDLAMVEMRTFTGRKHQVRVHASVALGSPVLMDSLYGGESAALPSDLKEILRTVSFPRQRFFLHAASLEIPSLGVTASAPTPSFWNEVLDLLKKD